MFSSAVKIIFTPSTILHGSKICQNCIRSSKLKSSSFCTLNIHTFVVQNIRLTKAILNRIVPNSKLETNSLFKRKFSIDYYINTNVKNDVMLYKYEDKKYFRLIHLFGVGQLIAWSILAYYTYTQAYWSLLNKNTNIMQFWKDNGLKVILFSFGVLTGPLLYVSVWLLSARTVKFLILNKGGEVLTVVTYHPFKSKAIFNVPVKHVKTNVSRKENKNYIPLKIRNFKLYFLMDSGGKFCNGKLFDNTVGFKKVW